ncbi:MAG TPA: 50S ribosomal protein P1 [Candidatus Poseidoniales archaeon]|nr:50S ribosomal protein P1 [Candidatus Poseidoniales archaeon]
MEYIYGAMLLHSAGKEIEDEAVTKVLKAAGVKVESSRVKALVASLADVDIEEAMSAAVAAPAAAASTSASAAGSADGAAEEAASEPEEEEEEEAAFGGLGDLFG